MIDCWCRIVRDRVREQILAAQKELTGLEVTLHQYRAAGPEFRPAILRHLSNIHSVGTLPYVVPCPD